MKQGSVLCDRTTISIKNLDRETRNLNLKPTTTRKLTAQERKELDAKLVARKECFNSKEPNE